MGKSTAKAAIQSGFQVVHTGKGNGIDLAQDIINLNLPPQHFAHIHGDLADCHWHKTLQKAGHTVENHIGFTTQFIPTLMAEQKAQVEAAETLVFFSKKATQHFFTLVKNVKFSQKNAICISQNVAQEVQPYIKNIQIAQTQDAEGIKAML